MHCVEHCKKLGLNAELMIEDKLDFQTLFDTVVLDNVIEHIQDPMPLLKECKRVFSIKEI